jgi:hypothetical protein
MKTRWYAKYFFGGIALIAFAAIAFYADFEVLALPFSEKTVVAAIATISALLGVGLLFAMRGHACERCGGEAQRKYFWVANSARTEMQFALEGGSAQRVVELIAANRGDFWRETTSVSCSYCARCRAIAILETAGGKEHTFLDEQAQHLVAFILADDAGAPGRRALRPAPAGLEFEHVSDAFQDQLIRRRADPGAMEFARAFAEMVSFYRQVRVQGCSPAGDSDALLYSWGIHDRGDGEQFELAIARRMIRDGADQVPDARQLRFAFRFPPDDALRALGHLQVGCIAPAGLDAFIEGVQATPAYVALHARQPSAARLDFGIAH